MKSLKSMSFVALAACAIAVLSLAADAAPDPRGVGSPCYGDAACIEARRQACPYADSNAPGPRAGRGMMGPGARFRGGCVADERGARRPGCPWAEEAPAAPALPPERP
jgi:hypothetical protein